MASPPRPSKNRATPGTASLGELDRLAVDHGIELNRPSPDGREVPVAEESKAKLLQALRADLGAAKNPSTPQPIEPVKPGSPPANGQCFVPDFLFDTRIWGLSLQLYELRSQRNCGIGDFADLKSMIDLVASLGGQFVGLNPLHAPFLADPSRCSPYEPSNRIFLNPLYIAPDALPGYQPDEGQRKIFSALRDTDLIDYDRVAAAKVSVLRNIWSRWKDS